MLRAIELRDFRCYAYRVFELGEKGSAWIGPNASGKTSALEAIQKVALLRGFGRDEEMIRWGAGAYRLRARLSDGTVEVLYERRRGTRVVWEGTPIQPLAAWIGRVPVVSLRPGDLSWIEGSGAERRRWADRLLSQTAPAYLEALTRYQRALEQRNALLTQPDPSPAQLESWENILMTEGIRIQQFRQALVQALLPALREFYGYFGGETIDLTYRLTVPPEVEQWRKAWQRLRSEELRRGHTLIGPHLEDFILSLQGHPARGYASEGQKKSLLIALKWAEVAHLRHERQQPPVLLLDDIGEKLDRHRLSAVGRLSRLAAQTFLTDTDAQRARETFPEVEIISMSPDPSHL